MGGRLAVEPHPANPLTDRKRGEAALKSGPSSLSESSEMGRRVLMSSEEER